jgi:hypothetical protein
LAGHPQPFGTVRRPAKGPIPLRSIGPLAGVTGVSDFYRRDVAPAARSQVSGLWNVASGLSIHLAELICKVENITGRRIEREYSDACT